MDVPADLNALLVFVRVVQAGSFSDAARRLDMPKSSVSKKVSDLEARLGTRLLHRTTRRLGLTDAGRIYFERGERIVADLEQADNAVAELQASPRGLLRVSVPLSLGVLGSVVARFLVAHPDVQVQVVCTDKRVDLVRDGFDLAVRAGPLDDSSLIARRIGTMKRVLVASPRYVRARGRLRAPEELAQHDCISFGGGPTPDVWSLLADAQRKDVRVQPRLSVNDFEMMLDAAREGVGIAWVPDFRSTDDLRDKRLINVLPAWCSIDIPVHAVYPSARHLSPKVARFIDALMLTFRT
jgi:DNA-binding transcriptional LysR family regulator